LLVARSSADGVDLILHRTLAEAQQKHGSQGCGEAEEHSPAPSAGANASEKLTSP
jgi:hypothetical protein